MALNFLLIISFMSILYPEIYADSSFFREVFYDKQKDLMEFDTENQTNLTRNLYSEIYNNGEIPSLIDINRIIYSGNEKELNITLFWPFRYSEIPKEFYANYSQYFVNVYLNSGSANEQNDTFDYIYNYEYNNPNFIEPKNVSALNKVMAFPETLTGGQWNLLEVERLDITNLEKNRKSIKLSPPPIESSKPFQGQELSINRDSRLHLLLI